MPSPISFLDLSKFTANFTERQLITILNFYEKEVKYKIHQNDTREEQAFLSLDSKKKKKKKIHGKNSGLGHKLVFEDRKAECIWLAVFSRTKFSSTERNSFSLQKSIVFPEKTKGIFVP